VIEEHGQKVYVSTAKFIRDNQEVAKKVSPLTKVKPLKFSKVKPLTPTQKKAPPTGRAFKLSSK
jgi:hypothetical protein